MHEPARKSYLDMMKSNMRAADKTHFITRLVYFGTYQGTDDSLQTKFEAVVNYLRSEYPDVPITGLLLVYPQYFLHIIETSEEMIFRHFKVIFNDKKMAIDLGKVLPLPPYHHVYHYFFPRWLKVSAKPPQLLEDLEGSDLPEIEKQLNNCLTKVYTLCEFVLCNARGSMRAVEEALKNLRENNQRYLPESTIIEFLLKSKSPILRDIREYVKMAQEIPLLRLYNGNGIIIVQSENHGIKTIIYSRIFTI